MSPVGAGRPAVGNVAVVMYSGRLSDRIGQAALIARLTRRRLRPSLWEWRPVASVLRRGRDRRSGLRHLRPRSRRRSPTSSAKARCGGTAIATFQMMSDFIRSSGQLGVGLIAQQLSFAWAFGIGGAILLPAATG